MFLGKTIIFIQVWLRGWLDAGKYNLAHSSWQLLIATKKKTLRKPWTLLLLPLVPRKNNRMSLRWILISRLIIGSLKRDSRKLHGIAFDCGHTRYVFRINHVVAVPNFLPASVLLPMFFSHYVFSAVSMCVSSYNELLSLLMLIFRWPNTESGLCWVGCSLLYSRRGWSWLAAGSQSLHATRKYRRVLVLWIKSSIFSGSYPHEESGLMILLTYDA